MVRFLSPAWFEEVARSQPPRPASAAVEQEHVVERVVRGGPDGDVRYRVVVAGGSAFLERPDGAADGSSPEPDLTIASDWITAAEIAQGTLSAQAALMTGRLRVRGNLARLAAWAGDLRGLDAVPSSVRRRTTY